MTPFYGAEETSASRRLYEDLQERLGAGGCTAIGGWAVFESTAPTYDEQSRDVDIVFSTPRAFNAFRHDIMPAWHLEWAGTPRRPTNACRFKAGHGPKGIVVDVFFQRGSDACRKRFNTMGGPLWKDIDCTGWLPPPESLLMDKLATLPKRNQGDREHKRFKDAIDSWALIFHNTEGVLPDEFNVPRGVRVGALREMPRLRAYSSRHADIYGDALDDLAAWLAA